MGTIERRRRKKSDNRKHIDSKNSRNDKNIKDNEIHPQSYPINFRPLEKHWGNLPFCASWCPSSGNFRFYVGYYNKGREKEQQFQWGRYIINSQQRLADIVQRLLCISCHTILYNCKLPQNYFYKSIAALGVIFRGLFFFYFIISDLRHSKVDLKAPSSQSPVRIRNYFMSYLGWG